MCCCACGRQRWLVCGARQPCLKGRPRTKLRCCIAWRTRTVTSRQWRPRHTAVAVTVWTDSWGQKRARWAAANSAVRVARAALRDGRCGGVDAYPRRRLRRRRRRRREGRVNRRGRQRRRERHGRAQLPRRCDRGDVGRECCRRVAR